MHAFLVTKGDASINTAVHVLHPEDKTVYLKGPKREIFVAGIFTEIRPVWVGDLETRPKI